ncbi:MAG: sugar MFS transporter [Halapricum sp.]
MSFETAEISSWVDLHERTRLTIVVFGFVAISGALIQIRGALFSSFQTQFLVSESQLGLLTPVSTVGFTAAILLFGSMTGRIDARRAMGVSVLLTGLLLVALGLSPIFFVLVAVEGLRSFSTGVFRAIDRPMLGHLYPDTRGQMVSLVAMVWALGAAAGPVLVTVVSTLGYDWPAVYFLLAVVCLPIAVLLFRHDVSGFEGNEQSFSVSYLDDLVHEPQIHVMMISLVLVGGIESGFFTWLPYYVAQSSPQTLANLSLSVYLVSYIPGRFLSSYLAGRYRSLNLLVGATVALPPVLWTALNTPKGPALLVAIFVVGLLMSGLFPTLITIGMESQPSFSGPVNAIGNVSARVGFLIVPTIIGVLAQVYTIGIAMRVQIVLGATLAATTIGFKILDVR